MMNQSATDSWTDPPGVGGLDWFSERAARDIAELRKNSYRERPGHLSLTTQVDGSYDHIRLGLDVCSGYRKTPEGY